MKPLAVAQQSQTKAIRHEWLVLLVNFASFAALAYFAFHANQHALYSQEDGVHWRILADEEFRWDGAQLGLSSQIFEALGSLRFPMNFHWMPEFVLPAMLDHWRIEPLPVLVLLACTLFLTTYFLARITGFAAAVALVAAWVLLLLFYPFFSEGLLYPMPSIGPPFAWNLMMTLLMVGLFWRMGRGPLVYIEIVVFIIVAFWVSIATPGMIAVTGPFVAVFALAAMIAAEDRRELFVKAGAVVAIFALAYFSGLINFILGIFLDTAAANFGHEILLPYPARSLDQASVLYHYRSFGPAGPILFVLGVCGAIRVAIVGTRRQRALAVAVSLTALGFAGGGALLILYTAYAAVSTVYYDCVMLAFYAIFAVDLVSAFSARAIRYLENSAREPWLSRLATPTSLTSRVFPLCLAVAPWLLLPAMIAARHPPNYLTPPAKTPIISQLESAIGLTPGAEYRGRVMSAFELGVTAPQNWLQLSSFGDRLWTNSGNDHQFDGLWWYGVPTLFEYNWVLSPYFYRVARDTLARPSDPQMRNFVTLRKIDPAVLKLFGVRYVIADAPLSAPARLIETQSVYGDPTTLYLYEFDGANLGNYSPTELLKVADAGASLALLQSGRDLSQVATVDELPGDSLVPASSVRLYAEKGGLRVIAASAGTSLIVLPFEYSHCLTLEPIAGNATRSSPTLQRVDFLLTGILFSGRLEARLDYFAGLLRNSGCLLSDEADFQRLGGSR